MSRVYAYPHYYALGYRWNTDEECDFVETCLQRWGPRPARRLLDIGCGAGRHVLELAARGYDVTGIDPAPEMVAYAREQAEWRNVSATFAAGSLQQWVLDGPFDAAWCLMDTFRFLLSDDEIIDHLRRLERMMAPGGLYVVDCWMPRTESAAPPAERYEWEQRSETTHIRVEYLQHPDSWDAAGRTFDDELIFHVQEDGQAQEIRGGRTRTRLLRPGELAALAQRAGWQVLGAYDGFDLGRPHPIQPTSWRTVTVLQHAGAR